MTAQLLEPLYAVVTAIMVAFHTFFKTLGVDPGSGLAWGGAIVGLVVVIRILLIPLFVKQINAQRGLQILQPEVKKIQTKYKGKTDPESRQKQQQEMMKLYQRQRDQPARELPADPAAGADLLRPLLGPQRDRQEPARREGRPHQRSWPSEAAEATIFGAPISDKFLGAESVTVQVVTAIMILLMSATTFLTQKQLMSKNMPADAMNNPFAQQQKILLYVFPLVFAVSGVNFPIGVLLYWLTTNLWSMGQQFYVIRRNPSPGSPAYEALERRRAAKAAKHPAAPSSGGAGGTTAEGATGTPGADGTTGTDGTPPAKPGQRQQPKRNKKKR